MLRGVVICPDVELNERLEPALSELGIVAISRVMDHYPNAQELLRFLRAHAPQVAFVSTEDMNRACAVVREMEKRSPGIQTIAVGRACDPELLLELMRVGIREFAAFPFDHAILMGAAVRVREMLAANPAVIETTQNVFSFLPSKAGVGTSTLALNVAVALSRQPDSNVLLADFDLNSGMMRFMLKLDNTYSVIDAAEHSFHMDEALWPPMVSAVDKLDVLHAGKLNPDFRIEPAQITHLVEFMRRNYRALCFDLSGNLEKYSLEIMHESKKIFLVCTPEIPSLHLAREKYMYLKRLELQDRICILLNRCQKRPLITPDQVEQLLGVPIMMIFPNDYQGVQRALTFGRWAEPATELGRQCTLLADNMTGHHPQAVEPRSKRFIEYFNVVPAKVPAASRPPAIRP